MSTEKTKRAVHDLKAALKQLKKIGVPSAAKYDARKPLTKSQKETVRKNYKKYAEIIEGRSQYVTRDASKLTQAEKKSLEAKGYHVVNNRLFIDKQGFDKVNIQRKTFKTEDGKQIPTVKIKRSKEGERPETEYHMPSHEFSNLQENLLRQYERGHFKSGDFMGVKIGRGGRARRVMMLSVSSIYKYLVDDFEPKDRGTDKDELLNHITLIKISTGDGRVHERTQKDKRKVSRERSKNRKAVSNKLVGKVSRSKKK
jgi:hypothetical protein